MGGVTDGPIPTEHTALIAEETIQTGSIKDTLMLIYTYCRACNWLLTLLTLLFYVLTIGASVASNFWLAEWSNAEGNKQADGMKANGTCDGENGPEL